MTMLTLRCDLERKARRQVTPSCFNQLLHLLALLAVALLLSCSGPGAKVTHSESPDSQAPLPLDDFRSIPKEVAESMQLLNLRMARSVWDRAEELRVADFAAAMGPNAGKLELAGHCEATRVLLCNKQVWKSRAIRERGAGRLCLILTSPIELRPWEFEGAIDAATDQGWWGVTLYQLLGLLSGSNRKGFTEPYPASPECIRWLTDRLRGTNPVSAKRFIEDCPQVPYGMVEFFLLASKRALGFSSEDLMNCRTTGRSDALGLVVQALQESHSESQLEQFLSFSSSSMARTLAAWFWDQDRASKALEGCHPACFPRWRTDVPLDSIRQLIARARSDAIADCLDLQFSVFDSADIVAHSGSPNSWAKAAHQFLGAQSPFPVPVLNGHLLVAEMGGFSSLIGQWDEGMCGIPLGAQPKEVATKFWKGVLRMQTRDSLAKRSAID